MDASLPHSEKEKALSQPKIRQSQETLRQKVLQGRELDHKIARLMSHPPSEESLSTIQESKKVVTYHYSSMTGYRKRAKGSEEQVAMAKMWEMKQMLSETHYCFTHGLSGNIAIMHDLFSLFDRADVSFPCHTPIYRKRFRLPGESMLYANADAFLSSPTSQVSDHNKDQRKLLISADAFLFQDSLGESALDFFKDNMSVWQKGEKEGWNKLIEEQTNTFLQWITASESFCILIKRGIREIMSSRFASLSSDLNQLYLIAIPKQTLDDPDFNYAYRSHGGSLSCDIHRGLRDDPYTNEKRLENQKAFSSLLAIHNSLDPSFTLEFRSRSYFDQNPDPTTAFPFPLFDDFTSQSSSPVCCNEIAQYRLLANNLDKDQEARVFTFNKYTAEEQQQYLEQMSPLVHLIKTVIRLESIDVDTASSQLESILLRLDLDGVLPGHSEHEQYLKGVKEILSSKTSFLEKHKEYLFQRLPTKHQELLQSIDQDSSAL